MSAEEGNDEDLAGGSVPKKGRQAKVVYGVNNKKFYATSTNSNSIEALKNAAKIESFEERENVLKANRPALMKLIRFFVFSNVTFSIY